MHYNQIEEQFIQQLKAIVGEGFVLTTKEDLSDYGHDCTEDLEYLPEVVVKPANTTEISKILRLCNEALIPVTPRGAGTGLSGGALPIMGGVVLSTQRLNKIIDIDERNFQATVEPGVVNDRFREALAEKGLYYPPDPASKGSCFLGGNLAHSSGGPRALKYGTTRDYVLNMELVLANGEVIMTGANTLKNSTGYNLTHLLIGSEGTLGVITKIVFKVIPLPKESLLLLAPFQSAEKACEAVGALFRAGCKPSACEFIEPEGFKLASALLRVQFEVKPDVGAYLLIEADGNDLELMTKECEQMYAVLDEYGASEVFFAQAADEKEYLWKLRRCIGEATKYNNVYKEEDTVVPRAELPVLFKRVKEIGQQYGFRTVCYGHAGDGNLHVNILKDQLSDEFWNGPLKDAISEIFLVCKELGGTISGEHGIGLVQKPYMHLVMPEVQLELMRGIKRAFDPNGILNPGKIF